MATVARSCLAFEAAIRKAIEEIDPFAEVRIETVSETDGSLNVNNVIRFVGAHIPSRSTMITIGGVILAYFANDLRSYGTDKILDRIFSAETAVTLSDEEMQKIVDAVARAVEAKVAAPEMRQVFREVARDEMIEGVGVTLRPKARPVNVVPREEFEARGAETPPPPEAPGDERTTVSEARVTLISPVLLPGKRRWRFRWGAGEFGAPVRDEGFLMRALSGQDPIPMRAGIMMDVEIETREVREGGVWVPKERTVLRVLRTYPAPEQASLFDLPPGADDENGEDAQ